VCFEEMLDACGRVCVNNRETGVCVCVCVCVCVSE